jgi:AraC-like DNA-binding protein
VALELGFSAESPFIAFFRSMVATTPAAFQRAESARAAG